MNDVIIIDLPLAHQGVNGIWSNGYPIHQGHNEDSLNYATVYAQERQITPDQEKLREDFERFVETLKAAGFNVHILPFPDILNQPGSLHHDAVFVRDAGFMIGDYWIKARFSARGRQLEADVHAPIIAERFNKKILQLPPGAYLECGDAFYVKAKNGSFYFGGLNRSNPQGHNFVRNIVEPEHFLLIESTGYHLDTIMSPVLNSENALCAILVVKQMLTPESYQKLANMGIELIEVDTIDASGEGEELGTYAINTLFGPGVMLNCEKFVTPGVEERLAEFGIKRFVSELTYHRYAGGSYHCLTNEIYT